MWGHAAYAHYVIYRGGAGLVVPTRAGDEGQPRGVPITFTLNNCPEHQGSGGFPGWRVLCVHRHRSCHMLLLAEVTAVRTPPGRGQWEVQARSLWAPGPYISSLVDFNLTLQGHSQEHNLSRVRGPQTCSWHLK